MKSRAQGLEVISKPLLVLAAWLAVMAAPASACGGTNAPAEPTPSGVPERPGSTQQDPYEELRSRMVERDIAARGVSDPEVLSAMRMVPRHEYVPPALIPRAYEDRPLPIGMNQTISQPYIVALMTELAQIEPGDRVLEIGTGSGYQAAVLSVLADRVFTIEILEELSEAAAQRLKTLGHSNIEFRAGDGYRGWPEEAPFDAIVVTAAPPHVPRPLIDQLALGARLIIPVGTGYQELLVIERTADGIEQRRSIPVRFVPMTGEAQDQQD